MVLGSKEIVLIATGLAGAIGAIVALCKASDDDAESVQKAVKNPVEKDSHVTDSMRATDIVMDETSAQAEAELVNTINTIRLNRLFKRLSDINVNQKNADAEIAQLKSEIEKIINSNRGGTTGMHGFIGESCQVHIANIKSFIQGKKPLYVLMDDNSMTDYMRGMQFIQQKACQSDNHLGLDHIRRHMEKYPEFLDEDSLYQIPKDFYEKFEQMKNAPADVALKFRKEDLRLWKAVQSFVADNPDIKIEPMEVSYSDIQAGKVNDTISDVEDKTEKEFSKQKSQAREAYAPNLKEMLKIAGIAALIEGTVEATFTLGSFILSGKRFKDLDRQDRLYILKRFLLGFCRGSIRACIVYVLTNMAKMSSAVATTITTLVFTLVRETYAFIKHKTEKAEYIKNLVWDSLEVALSALGAYVGRILLKKHPILGSLLGSFALTSGLRFTKKYVYA